jgi:hypothetical protein
MRDNDSSRPMDPVAACEALVIVMAIIGIAFLTGGTGGSNIVLAHGPVAPSPAADGGSCALQGRSGAAVEPELPRPRDVQARRNGNGQAQVDGQLPL